MDGAHTPEQARELLAYSQVLGELVAVLGPLHEGIPVFTEPTHVTLAIGDVQLLIALAWRARQGVAGL